MTVLEKKFEIDESGVSCLGLMIITWLYVFYWAQTVMKGRP